MSSDIATNPSTTLLRKNTLLLLCIAVLGIVLGLGYSDKLYLQIYAQVFLWLMVIGCCLVTLSHTKPITPKTSESAIPVDWVNKMSRWNKAVPIPAGMLPSGEVRDVLNVDNVALIMFDSNGRVHQFFPRLIEGGTARTIDNGRTAIIEMMDRFNIQDNNWSVISKEDPHNG